MRFDHATHGPIAPLEWAFKRAIEGPFAYDLYDMKSFTQYKPLTQPLRSCYFFTQR